MKKIIILTITVALGLGLALQAGAESWQGLIKASKQSRKYQESSHSPGENAALKKTYQAFRQKAASLFKDKYQIENQLRSLLARPGFDHEKAKELVDRYLKVRYKINLLRNEHMAKLPNGLGFIGIKRRVDMSQLRPRSR